jgi:penicillin-binding protein 1C
MNPGQVAFKTGTSYGYRDAWAAGHGGGYTVIAWVGRADGAARPGETGRKAAAPLLFDAFDLIGEIFRLDRHDDGLPTEESVTPALARLGPAAATTPPQIVFPQDRAELFFRSGARGFSLSARGGAGAHRWFIDGSAVAVSNGQAIWRPDVPGFYDVTVVDAAGRATTSKVRVVDPVSAG